MESEMSNNEDHLLLKDLSRTNTRDCSNFSDRLITNNNLNEKVNIYKNGNQDESNIIVNKGIMTKDDSSQNEINAQKIQINYLNTDKIEESEHEDDIKNIRKDVYGCEIKKGGKHKISFADDLYKSKKEKNKEKSDKKKNKKDKKKNKNKKNHLIEIIEIQNFKNYTKINSYDHEFDDEETETCCSGACNVF